MTDLSWLNLSEISTAQKRKLADYLYSYLTGSRRNTFERVLARRTSHITVVAEDTHQEHNASALIRTCDCFGIQNMHIIEQEHVFRIARGMTKGAEKWVDLHFYTGADPVAECTAALRSAGYRIVATTPDPNGIPLPEFDARTKSAILFGREKEGLSRALLAEADTAIHIPMFGFSESFNVSVSAAIILHSITTQLQTAGDTSWKLDAGTLLEKRIEWSLKTIQNSRYIFEDFLRKIS